MASSNSAPPRGVFRLRARDVVQQRAGADGELVGVDPGGGQGTDEAQGLPLHGAAVRGHPVGRVGFEQPEAERGQQLRMRALAGAAAELPAAA